MSVTIRKRVPKRSRVFLTAELDCGAGATAVHIRDISRSGALVDAEQAPQPGAPVRLSCGDTTVAARVAWVDGKFAGLEFLTPIVGGDLVDATGAKLKVSAPRSYRSGEFLD